MVAFLRSEAELDIAEHACITKNVLAKAGSAVLMETAQKLVAIRRKELLDHCGEHGC
jgi:hypothetical protein